MGKYLYETHLHTSPVSKCSKASVRESLEFYKSLGYAGVFITNHFVDGNLNYDKTRPYEELIEFYFSDYEEGLRIGREIGIDVFSGIESSYNGTDFLVYGLDKEWFLTHPDIRGIRKSELLAMMAEAGALIIHAHPFRESQRIDHIRLFPRAVHGVEIYNACRSDFENSVAERYAEIYDLIPFAGSDNHKASRLMKLGGMSSDVKIKNEQDFVARVKNRELEPFRHIVEE